MKSLIIGPGMDGTHLAEHLTNRGDEVYVMHRRTSSGNLSNLKKAGLLDKVKTVEGDIADPHCVHSILNSVTPDEVYNVAAQSHVATSFTQPKYTNDVNYVGVLNILEWLKTNQRTKLYQSSTSEMFGDMVTYQEGACSEHTKVSEITTEQLNRGDFYQDESTPFNPQSPYAISKLAAHQLCQLYKNSYDVKVWSGILFNHDGPYRGEQFVTRKITKWCAGFAEFMKLHSFSFTKLRFLENEIIFGADSFPKLRLGNIHTCRDLGYAGEYTELMIRMLQQDVPDFYVVATGKTTRIEDFLYFCFAEMKFPEYIWQNIFLIDEAFFRPSEVPYLRGKSDKIQKALSWEPKYNYQDIARTMLSHDSRELYGNP